jgi:hypothetical protein
MTVPRHDWCAQGSRAIEKFHVFLLRGLCASVVTYDLVMLTRPAVFLDRDGTLTLERGYLTRPEQVRLLPGAAEAIRLLREKQFACILITNQSAVGRGLLTDSPFFPPGLSRLRHLETQQFCPLQVVLGVLRLSHSSVDRSQVAVQVRAIR